MMGFGTAIHTCLRKYATFSGRASRAEFWWFTLFTTIIFIGLDSVDRRLGWVADIGLLLPYLAVSWRRLQDVGKNGWWTLVPLAAQVSIYADEAMGGQLTRDIATAHDATGQMRYLIYVVTAIYVGLNLYVLYLNLKRGDIGANKYGDDPYQTRADPSVFD